MIVKNWYKTYWKAECDGNAHAPFGGGRLQKYRKLYLRQLGGRLPDSDNDYLADADEQTGDSDGDGFPDYRDNDDDDDG